MTIEQLARYAQAHGMQTDIVGQTLLVAIDWYMPETGETGTDWEKANTFQRLRNVLGY